jgi:hypothetical protein
MPEAVIHVNLKSFLEKPFDIGADEWSDIQKMGFRQTDKLVEKPLQLLRGKDEWK